MLSGVHFSARSRASGFRAAGTSAATSQRRGTFTTGVRFGGGRWKKSVKYTVTKPT